MVLPVQPAGQIQPPIHDRQALRSLESQRGVEHAQILTKMVSKLAVVFMARHGCHVDFHSEFQGLAIGQSIKPVSHFQSIGLTVQMDLFMDRQRAFIAFELMRQFNRDGIFRLGNACQAIFRIGPGGQFPLCAGCPVAGGCV